MARRKKEEIPNKDTKVTKAKVKGDFKYERLSASMMKTWLQCKRKFYCNYISRDYNPPQEHFTLGSAVHRTLEQVNLSLQANPRELNAFEIEDYVQKFKEDAASGFVMDLQLFETGEEVLRSELLGLDNEEVIGVEMEFDVTTPEGVRLYGFIDKLTRVDDTTIRVVDYKTSQNPMSFEDARKDEQLAMYDLAISMLYPTVPKRIIELNYLRTGDKVRVVKTDIERHNFRLLLLAVHKAITEFMSTTERDLAGEVNSFCPWCSFRNGCPNYNAYRSTILPDLPESMELTDVTFVEKWEMVSSILSIAKKWQEELKTWAAFRLEDNPDVPITNGKKEIYMASATRRDYDTAMVCRSIGLEDLLGASTNGNSLVKLNTSVLDQFLKVKKDKKLTAKVEKATTVKFNSPSIRVRKKS